MISDTNAEGLAICEAAYRQLQNQENFPSFDDKIKYLLSYEQTCSGTGLYESRLAYYYVMNRNYDAAENTIKKGLASSNEYHRELEYSLVDLAVSKGNLSEAFNGALKLKNKYPGWHGSYLLLAKISLMQTKFEDCIKYSIESNKLLPEAGVYVGMTIAYHQLGKDEQAFDAILHAISLDPGIVAYAAGMNEAIYSLVKLNKLKEAEMLAETRIKNDSGWYKDVVFYKAVKFLKEHGFLAAVTV